jgi:hypothetical protein
LLVDDDWHALPSGQHESLRRGVAVDDRVLAWGALPHVERGALLGSGLVVDRLENPVCGRLPWVFLLAREELLILQLVLVRHER